MQCQCTDKANFLTLDPDHRHQHKRHTKGKKIRKYKEISVLPNVRDKKATFLNLPIFQRYCLGILKVVCTNLKVRKIAEFSIPPKKTEFILMISTLV